MNRKLAGTQVRSGAFGKEENVFPLPGNEPRLFDYPSNTTVTILTELSQLTKERGRGMYCNGKTAKRKYERISDS